MERNENAVADLDKAFKTVGSRYGYVNVTAEFGLFTDFKLRWARNGRHTNINFVVSDYLNDAPFDVLRSLADTIFRKLDSNGRGDYDGAFRQWVLDPEFSESKRQTFINRSRTLTGPVYHDNRDLRDSVRRLKEMELIKGDENIEVAWNDDGSPKAGGASVLFRVVTVNSRLAYKDVPDYVVDFVVYSKYLCVIEGAKVFGYSEEVHTRDKEMLFDMYHQAEQYLDNLGMYL